MTHLALWLPLPEAHRITVCWRFEEDWASYNE